MSVKPLLVRILSFFALVSMACNLPFGGTAPTPAPGTPPPAPESATATPAPVSEGTSQGDILFAEDIEDHPTGLMDNFRRRVAAGEWTEEEGLLKTLQFALGEVDADAIGPETGNIISVNEGSGIVRAAASYVAGGPDAETRAQLQDLLDRIFIDTATLERLSVPAGQSSTPGGARVARMQGQDPQCAAFWRGGFPVDSTATCFEYRLVEVGGREYRLFIPVDMTVSDNRLLQADGIMEGIPTAVNAFLPYGEMPSADLVFTELPGRTSLTWAATRMGSPGGRCQIAIFPHFGSIASPDEANQIIAHELFHCLQYQNYHEKIAQYGSGAEWWVEGTATFFSNVAYPTVNSEHQYINSFAVQSLENSLVEMDYPSFLFFQYMANQRGENGVMQLIRLMPETAGVDVQRSALAGYPGIQELFHDFGKAYIDKTIQDTGGGNLPFGVMLRGQIVMDTTNEYPLSVDDFVLARYLLVFPEDTVHTLSENYDPSITVKVRPRGADSTTWIDMPEKLQACQQRQLVWLGTSARGDGSEQTYTLSDEVEERETECDRCLVGNWRMNNDSFWAAFESNLAMAGDQFRPTLQRFDGEVLLQFTPLGDGTATYNGFDVNYTQTISMSTAGTGSVDATMRIQGASNFSWYTLENVLYVPLVFSQPVYEPNLVVTFPGVPASNFPVSPPPVQVPGVGPYICTPTTLQMDQMGNGMYILYDKVRP